MELNFNIETEKELVETKNKEDSITISQSMSMNDEKVFLSIKYKIFKGFSKDKDGEFILKTEFGKPNSKIKKYSTFSVDRVFINGYDGRAELKNVLDVLNTEDKLKQYFKL